MIVLCVGFALAAVGCAVVCWVLCSGNHIGEDPEGYTRSEVDELRVALREAGGNERSTRHNDRA